MSPRKPFYRLLVLHGFESWTLASAD